MRIFLNQRNHKDQKPNAKFFEMAVIFAREHNKILEEELNRDNAGEHKELPESEKVKIVLPYSFLLTKAKLLMPELLGTVRDGQEEKRFIKLVNDNDDLFEFKFTEEDRRLYQELYKQIGGLVGASRGAMDAEAAARTRAAFVGVISETDVNSLRHDARAINNDLKWAGQNLDTWFEDRGIAPGIKLPALRPNSDAGEAVGGPGLFRAILVNSAAKKLLKIPAGFLTPSNELPPVSEANKAIYTDLFRQAAELMERINEDVLTRQVHATAGAKQEKMKGRKQETARVSSNDMEALGNEVARLNRQMDAVPADWLVTHKICSGEEQRELGLPLFHAALTSNKVRKVLRINNPIDQSADQSIFDLAMEAKRQDETVIYAADNKLLREKAQAASRTEASLSPDFAGAVAGAEAGADADGGEAAERTGAIGQILASKGAVVKKKVIVDPQARPDAHGLAQFEVTDSGQLFRSFLRRLDRWKNGTPARDESIELAKEAILHAAERHGHSGSTPSRPLGSVDDDIKALDVLATDRPGVKDPDALRRAASEIGAILARDGKKLPSSVRGALNAAKKAADNLSPDVERGGHKRAADE